MLHVLVVDDNPDIRRVARRSLESLGCRVTEAHNGDAAITAQRTDPADVLVTDMVMPGKEGVELIREFRRDYAGVRIVAMSGGGVGGATSYLQMARAFGAASVLPKPFTREELASAVGIPRPAPA